MSELAIVPLAKFLDVLISFGDRCCLIDSLSNVANIANKAMFCAFVTF